MSAGSVREARAQRAADQRGATNDQHVTHHQQAVAVASTRPLPPISMLHTAAWLAGTANSAKQAISAWRPMKR